ncbi:dihydrofolate reductase family protein [Anaerospora hongkongensis]|uniref:dihydrofolate reductase family protein n=1 Tax=Anaerospora hongkongensis TaxID=244830 RepID=UPI002898A2CF|nr:dihydrofolate reductase family protein [Anaerospora hongkongensis]
MRKVILDLAVTLDGFIEAPNGEVDWCIMDEEMAFEQFLSEIDTILYGRKSYELWGEYTPDDHASENEQQIWTLIHSKKKIVFSTTQTDPSGEVQYINSNIEAEIRKLKQGHGKDIWLYGGANLISTFINLGLVDEYRLSVHPVVLGAGKPLFESLRKRLSLGLTDVRRYSSGVVQLVYRAR